MPTSLCMPPAAASHSTLSLATKLLYTFFGGLECIGHSFAYVVHLLYFREMLDSKPSAVASMRDTNLATRLSQQVTNFGAFSP